MYDTSGYIKLSRKILDWQWFNDRDIRDVFLYLLLTANWKRGSFEGVDVYPGQVVTSIRKLAKETQHSIQHTRTILSTLQATHEITQQTTHRFTVITIVNWAKYQGGTSQSNTENSTQTSTQTNTVTPENQHSNQQQYKNNIKNSLKKMKKIKKEGGAGAAAGFTMEAFSGFISGDELTGGDEL